MKRRVWIEIDVDRKNPNRCGMKCPWLYGSFVEEMDCCAFSMGGESLRGGDNPMRSARCLKREVKP